MRMRNFKITENALTNLIISYSDHKLMCEAYEAEYDLDCDLYNDPDYSHHAAYCHAFEEWMRAMGISPESNFVTGIIEKERQRRSN